MPRMICTRAFTYGTRALEPYDEFDAENEEHANVLIAANKARRAPAVAASNEYQTRQLTAQRPEPHVRSDQYGRRDRRAKH
jgi:hypothetical protein